MCLLEKIVFSEWPTLPEHLHEYAVTRNKSVLVGEGRVIRPKLAEETDVLRFDSKLVVNGGRNSCLQPRQERSR
jgi:hypothetical protein